MPIFEDVTERMPGGFIVYTADKDEKVLYANAAALDIFGCASLDEFMTLVDGSFHGMVYPEDRSTVEETITQQIRASSNKQDHVLYRIQRKDGQIRWVEDYGHLVHTEKIGDLYYVFLYDITEKKLAEDEARRVAEALLVEKRLSEAKNAFIFNLSHDIRTPMNAILGYAELARKHLAVPAQAEAHLDKVITAGQYLLALIDDLLELSELDVHGVHLKTEDHGLAGVVAGAVNMLRPNFEAKHIAVSINASDGEARVLIDAPRFQRALSNILSNAAKFTPDGGSVTISVTRKSASQSGYVRFDVAVTDTGVGMDPEFVKKAFEPFEREQSSTRSGRAGTGIGLTVTKRIMDILGGSVSAVSEKGKGSTFTLSLPLKVISSQSQARPQPQERVLQTASGKGRILLVEDIEINRMLAETVLTEAGFEVESVPDGCDAVDAVANTPAGYYSAVLMDIQMPVMNGYEATRAIRALNREDIVDLPIIALSANARPADRAMSFECGMNAHVAKPFDVEGLIATINKYLPKE